MLYKHWKKIVLALTGFFWASCDETSSSPVSVNEDTPSSSITETEGASSSSKAKSAASSAKETSVASSAERSSSSKAKSAASSAEEAGKTSSSKAVSAASSEAASSAASSAEEAGEKSSAESATSNATDPNSEVSSSSKAKSSSSSKRHHRSSSSVMDEPVDLYGCPSDICGPFISDTASIADTISIIAAKYGVILPESSSSSSISQIAAKYGVIRPESSSSLTQIVAKYGVPSKTTCTVSNAKDGKVVYTCEDGVTCEEETKTEMQAPACNGDVCPKYGVVKISKKTYTCDNGKVYNEAEFQMFYDTLPVIEDVVIKDSIQAPIALYGPPCVFDGTCNKEN